MADTVFFVIGLALCQLASAGPSSQEIPQTAISTQVDQLLYQGHFQQASNLLNRALACPGLAERDRKNLAFELDRIERIRKDYPHSERALFTQLQKAVKNFTWDEFQLWIREGRFDSRSIEGQRFFMVTSFSNLFFRYPELNDRRTPKKNSAVYDKAVYETCAAIKAAARVEQKPYVLPKRFQVTMTINVQPRRDELREPSPTIRAWLPVPREYPFQDGFELFSSSSPLKNLSPPSSPIRSALLEQPARKDKATEFRIQYGYTMHGVSFDLDPSRIRSCEPTNESLRPFLQEAPHVQFTPELRRLAREIRGSESNSLLIAKKFHNWIAENIQYSYAIEYSTIRNISEYCRTKRYGDCGQEALLFISLCRVSGIPARWQSGWTTFPGAKTIHDWTEIYLEPYGWIPVDPYMGIYAMQYANTLSHEQRLEVRDFYFGGLDQYRLIANSDHCQELSPPKRSLRSDTVDFQRGELESADQNIYFDKFTYDLVAREIKLPRDQHYQ